MQKILVPIYFLFLTLSINVYGQSDKIDSLRNELSQAKHDTSICKLYLDIGDFYEDSHPDSALLYYHKCLQLSEEKGLRKFQATSLRYIGFVYRSKIDFENALKYFELAVEIEEALGNAARAASLYNSIGNIYRNKGVFDKAMEYYFKSLKIEEDSGNKLGMSSCFNNMGNVFLNQRNTEKALEYFEKSLELKVELNDINGISICYSNIGNAHISVKRLDMALEYYLKALKIDEELGLKRRLSVGYNNIGLVYLNQKNFGKALEYYKKSKSLDQEFGNKFGLAIVNTNIAHLHSNLADSTTGNSRLVHQKAAIEHAQEAYSLAKEVGAFLAQRDALSTLVKVYRQFGEYKKAFEYVDKLNAVRDSIFSNEKTHALADMQTRYETEKKQQEINSQQLVIERHEIDIKRKRAQRNFLIAGSIFLAILLALLFWGYRQKVQINNIILEKNALLEHAYEEISVQKDEIMEQRDMVIAQNQQIEQKNHHIADSIAYAQLIQNAVLPTDDYTRGILGEHFLLFKPKDVVSGDFFWTTRIDNWIFFAVADCTGHGVPGAFMSLLGISFLKEIITNKPITEAGKALDYLRESIIEALHQKGQAGDQKDGMDIALCMLNTENNQLQFAGANNPLIIVTPQKELTRFNSDLQPVSYHFNMKPFSTQTLSLAKGDCIYLATDGFQDQLGGDDNKKFMGKALRELLLEIAHKPMDEQKEILNETFNQWIGQNEQIDDVTIFGVRV